jgi:hypothetical protein
MKVLHKPVRFILLLVAISVAHCAASASAVASVSLLFQGQQTICVVVYDLSSDRVRQWNRSLSTAVAGRLQGMLAPYVSWVKVRAPDLCAQPTDPVAYENQIQLELGIKRMPLSVGTDDLFVTILDGASPNRPADLSASQLQPVVRIGKSPLRADDALAGLTEFLERNVVPLARRGSSKRLDEAPVQRK